MDRLRLFVAFPKYIPLVYPKNECSQPNKSQVYNYEVYYKVTPRHRQTLVRLTRTVTLNYCLIYAACSMQHAATVI